MVDKAIREQRCEDVLSEFTNGHYAVFFTLTTPDVVDLTEMRKRWRALRHYLVQNCFPSGVKYVMNYELHPNGHGWHIHSVWNHYIDLRRLLPKIRAFGFGRVDVRRVTSKGVADYLTKHALKAYRGVSLRERESNPSFRLRLVNTSRGLPRLDDYAWKSDLKSSTLELLKKARDKGISSGSFGTFRRMYLYTQIAALIGVRRVSDLSALARSPARFVRDWLASFPDGSPVYQCDFFENAACNSRGDMIHFVSNEQPKEGNYNK